MAHKKTSLTRLFLLILIAANVGVYWFLPHLFHEMRDLAEVKRRVIPQLEAQLSAKGLELGKPAFIRIFKETKELEVWLEKNGQYALFKTYPICKYSGKLGPKQKEGDQQAPEGFYTVARYQMNPKSNYHLAFNTGFPNEYDRANGYAGSFLMVHGDCVSIGCYAMTDMGIEEIYLLMDAALRNKQPFIPVHIFPFRMTKENLEKHKDSNWLFFWTKLQLGYDYFEINHHPPVVAVKEKQYSITN